MKKNLALKVLEELRQEIKALDIPEVGLVGELVDKVEENLTGKFTEIKKQLELGKVLPVNYPMKLPDVPIIKVTGIKYEDGENYSDELELECIELKGTDTYLIEVDTFMADSVEVCKYRAGSTVKMQYIYLDSRTNTIIAGLDNKEEVEVELTLDMVPYISLE